MRVPQKVRALRKFAQRLGITRPYLHRKDALLDLVLDKLRESNTPILAHPTYRKEQ